jgi:RHS repeat-associated protein
MQAWTRKKMRNAVRESAQALGLVLVLAAMNVQAESGSRTRDGMGQAHSETKVAQERDRRSERRDGHRREHEKHRPAVEVTLDAPAAGTVFAAPATIELSASADVNLRHWEVLRVEFYANGELLSTATSPPYGVTWAGVGEGSYTLIAKAYAANPSESKGRDREHDRRERDKQERNRPMWVGSSEPVEVTVTATAAKALYFIQVDHLATPRLVADETQKTVWRWDNQEPFGNNPANEDPDADGIAFDLPLRLPGQYYDRESGLHYNYFRDYDPSIGRYAESDPIGLNAGLNTYTYVLDNPMSYLDPYGLQVNVCYYADAAGGFGHIGFGVGSETRTFGYYPSGNPFGSPGMIKEDSQKIRECKVVPSDPDQDQCMIDCRARRQANPGDYNLTSNQCTSFVRDCLSECGLPTGNFPGSAPRNLFLRLPGRSK